MAKVTQEQFNKICDLVAEIQKTCPDADTSSINMWLTFVAPEEKAETGVDEAVVVG